MPQLFLLQKTEVRCISCPAVQCSIGCAANFEALPQNTDVLTWHYVFCMGMYRAFYLLNWVWRYMTQVPCKNQRSCRIPIDMVQINHCEIRMCCFQEGYSDWIVWVSGIVQTVLYLDFFYYYIKWYARAALTLFVLAKCAPAAAV
eukprot:SAG31_NODE_4615_length_3094_cov_1.935559_2_plen_145_part_00